MAYAGLIEPHWLEWVYRDMPLQGLPETLWGKTLMQISDIHAGDLVSESYLIESLQQAQLLEPDILVYTGDYVHFENDRTYAQLERIADHLPRGSSATLGILGNHDYGHGWSQPGVAERISRILRKRGVDVLRNERRDVQGLTVAGMDDFWGTAFDPRKCLKGIPADRDSIVLCHNPDVCDLDIWGDFRGWILSGHTHGGQCRIPLFGTPVLPVSNKSYNSGEFDLGRNRRLYINRALGHLFRIRFGVRPEITVFTLLPA